MAIRVKGEVLIPAREDGSYETRRHYYADHDGLARVEARHLSGESDFFSGAWVRRSTDNGRTWGPWEDKYSASFQSFGKDEIMSHEPSGEVWNPVHRNYVGIGMQRFFFDGHEEAYKRFWGKGESSFRDHIYLYTRGEHEDSPASTLVKYEEGADFDPGNLRNADYLDRNLAYFADPIVLKSGDIAFPMCVPVTFCCRVLGIDVQQVFPSCPQIMHGLLVARGAWNGSTGSYDLSFSRPIVISDLASSRGSDEPTIAELESGRLVVVFRGSNTSKEAWRTRIEPGTPGFKWFTHSDDGGRTFTDPVPWHFDDGEVIYSSASISRFLKSETNGKNYWIGNITAHNVNGNYPRFPLQIVQIDENFGTARKDTLTVIDTLREGESELLQLSNFFTVQNRETGEIELYLAKLGQHAKGHGDWRAETWKYSIDVGT